VEQLKRWSERVGCDFVGSEAGATRAVAFDALERAIANDVDVVIVDTAGASHADDLMKELEKVHRVIGKKLPGAPHETLMVLDSTVGQNALAQIRSFGQTLPLTGIVLTKMDGTAKGGIVVAIKEEFDLPVKFIGVGESLDDLVPFEIDAFAEEVLTG
jgi:fused signal recognition particle receptor